MEGMTEQVTVTHSVPAQQLGSVPKEASLTAACPECNASISMASNTVMGEILSCPDCGTELEVTGLAPLQLAPAPHEEEDWGE